jgi:hypothetical protein
MEIDPKILSTCPEDLDAAVEFLREAGLSKVASMMALHDRFGLSAEAAKTAVHFHARWADRREADETFHEALGKAFENLTTGATSSS